MTERAMITDPDVYFARGCGRCDRFDSAACSSRIWREGLAALRAICLEAGLEEVAKWGHPVYRHAGRNIAILGAFRDNFRLSFFNAGLMRDPEGVLTPQGPNTQTAGTLRFDHTDAPGAMAGVIAAYLSEAMAYAEAGVVSPKVARQLDWPEELTEALDADPELAEAFHALTPGRQRSYLFNLSTAKKAETRVARIGTFREKIIAGKGAQER